MNFKISTKADIFFGAGSSLNLGENIKSLDGKKALVVYDPIFDSIGKSKEIIESINAAGVETVTYNKIEPDSPDYSVLEVAKIARESNVDILVAIGGGSCIDTTKAANVMINNPVPLTQYCNPAVKQNPGKHLILVPSTAGSGSEITTGAMVRLTNGPKVGLPGKNTQATIAVIDPNLYATCPKSLTAACGMDALSHAVGSLSGAYNRTPLSEIIAIDVVKRVLKYLPIVVNDTSNMEAREQMAYASLMGGYAFADTPPHIDHAIAHAMGAACHVPHGVACSISLPMALEYVSEVVPDRIDLIAEIFKIEVPVNSTHTEIGKLTADFVREFADSLGLPKLGDYVKPEHYESVAALAKNDVCAMLCPKPVTEEAVVALLESEASR